MGTQITLHLTRLEAFRFASYQDLDQNFDTVVEVLNVTSPYPLK